MMNLDISSLPKIKFTQRDIIASLTLLILIVIVVILLVGGSARVNMLEIPIDLIKAEIAATGRHLIDTRKDKTKES